MIIPVGSVRSVSVGTSSKGLLSNNYNPLSSGNNRSQPVTKRPPSVQKCNHEHNRHPVNSINCDRHAVRPNPGRFPLRTKWCTVMPATATNVCTAAAASSQLMAAGTLFCAVVVLMMALLPRWSVTQKVAKFEAICIPLALAYGYLLFHSWEPDTLGLIMPGSWKEGFSGGFKPQFFPELVGICRLFSRAITAASLWLHLLAVNLFAATHIYREGLRHGLPTAHSVLLCFAFGPLGLLSHAITKLSLSTVSRDQDGKLKTSQFPAS